jgi:hypothetical protein
MLNKFEGCVILTNHFGSLLNSPILIIPLRENTFGINLVTSDENDEYHSEVALFVMNL